MTQGPSRSVRDTRATLHQRLLWIAVISAVAILAHTAPFPFLLDVTERTVWRMPQTAPHTIYLTFDDGPNPAATGDLLDVLARHQVTATFFVIDKHLTESTAPLVRRAFEEGHAVALHSHTRMLMFKTPGTLASTLTDAFPFLGLRCQQITERVLALLAPRYGWPA